VVVAAAVWSDWHMAQSTAAEPTGGTAEPRLWPFGARAAILAVPLIAAVLLIAFGLSRVLADWPESRSDNLVLIGVVVLSMVPLLLVALDLVASRGGSIEVRGVVINFAGQLRTHSELTIAANIGMPGVPVPDSGSEQILDTLRAAVANEIAVVDLEDGSAWWETRLVTLCAGATRLDRPRVIVFVATEEGRQGRFQGWGEPEALLRALLRADRRYRESYEAARVAAAQWALVQAYTPGQQPVPVAGLPQPQPPVVSLATSHPHFAFSYQGDRNELAQEQFLAADLGEKAEPPEQGIDVVRLRQLFAPVLRSDHLENDWSSERRIEAALATDAPYMAITDGGRYLGLLARDAVQNSILQALVARETSARADGASAPRRSAM
jgi:hypothetical protein